MLHDLRSSYEGISKSFRNGRLEQELQMVQLYGTRCSYITILWVSLIRFVAITLCVAFQWVFTVVVYFVIDSVRKLLDTPSYSIVKLPFIKAFLIWPSARDSLTLWTFKIGQVVHPWPDILKVGEGGVCQLSTFCLCPGDELMVYSRVNACT
jgi:hypothetical protein